MKTILVTGGAGFIGSHTVDALLRAGHKVIVYDEFTTGDYSNLLEAREFSNFTLEEGNICNKERLMQVFIEHEPESVIHLAAMTHVGECERAPEACFQNNVVGTFTVTRLCAMFHANLVFASSAAVYLSPSSMPIDEHGTLTNKGQYGNSKILGEMIVRSAGLTTAIFRFFNVFGPRATGGVIKSFLYAKEGVCDYLLCGDGKQTRDFIFVGDIVKMLVKAAVNEKSGLYNLCTGKGTTVRQVLDMIDPEAQPRYMPPVPCEIRHSIGDPSKAKRDLKFKPQVQLKDWIDSLMG